MKFDSKLIHSGEIHDQFGSATVPIYQTSTFKFENADHGARLFRGEEQGYIYTRIANPTIRALEQNIASLENGYDAIAFSSGMAAVTNVYFTILSAGAHIISAASVYGPSRGVIEQDFSRFGVEYSYLHASDINAIEKAIRKNTKLIYLETPANPTMEVSDIQTISEIAHKHGIYVAVDNTFATPYLQKPLDLGADIVLHSVTKFINGHADIVGGIVIAKDAELYKKLRHSMAYIGTNMDPHQAFLVLRGVKTLALRVERAQQNAIKVADFLIKHPKIAWVNYPGLKTHPQYALIKKQMKGPGSMLSFGLKGGFDAGKKLMDNVKMILLAVSLGGVESLIQHPASMTHSAVSKENKLAAGITDDLVRLSVGIEDVDDIIADLDQALEKC
jgi:methionine-gamma-lyase